MNIFKEKLISALIIVFMGISSYAESKSQYSSSVYGGVGLIETPTARFHGDGNLSFGVSFDNPVNRVYGAMQFLPNLEVVLRYTEETYRPYNPGSSQTHKDKGLDLKFRLFKETERFPELAVGLGDIGGTGQFSREFIVASKRIGNVDYTLGMGWGKFAGIRETIADIKNPFIFIHDSFDDRDTKVGFGGSIDIGQFFSGKTSSIFAGLEYFTPIENLSLKLEYDPTYYFPIIGRLEDYRDDNGPLIELDSRLNLGLNYRYAPSAVNNIDLSLAYVRGNTIMASATVHSNLHFLGDQKYTAPRETLNKATFRPFNEQKDAFKEYLPKKIMQQMANEGFVTHSITFNNDELIAEISQGRFQKTIQALDLASRILANNSPRNIKTITVVNIDQGIETFRSSIPREKLVEAVSLGPLEEELLSLNESYSLHDDHVRVNNDFLYPHFSWSLRPNMNGTIQHQIQFYFYQLEALFHAEYAIKKGLYISTDIGIDITNNFDEYTWHITDGELHNVRQDRRLYLTEGATGIRKLAIEHTFDISRDTKAILSAGYLEWMYGGIGGQIVHKPINSPWGIGAEGYWVKQREFDQKFSFQEFQTFTGFINFFYDLPFYDLRFQSSAGKFLGTDVGFTFDLSRRFDSGARVGAGFALTDCDAECTGEGSFNKWIYFELPMDPFYVSRTTRAKTGYGWNPLTKNSGNKISAGSLYELVTDATDEMETLRRDKWSVRKILSGFGSKPKNRL